jgi:exopolyphosphatase/pppGpp-phosphohydrolase
MIVGSIDIGSNTVLLFIAEVDESTWKINTLSDEQTIMRISRGYQIQK